MEKPDTAWAWVVVIAAACIRVIVYGNSYTSGVVYFVILEVFQKSRAETSWIASVITAATFATCPVSGVLVNRFGTRKVALCGGVVASTGLMLSSFATSLPILALCYGVITGIGCGLTFIPGSVAVARYFSDKRRNIAMGVASAGGGVGTFAFPPIINYLNETYAWRGMFMILSGISLNMCVFALLYRPVSSHNNNSDKAADQEQPITTKKETERKKNVWTFLKRSDFYILGLNNILYQLGATVIYGHLGTYVYRQLHFEKFYASLLYSFIGCTVMLCKLCQGFLIQRPRWKICQPYQQYIIWYCVGGLSTVCLFLDMGYAGLVIFSLLFGASYAACGGSLIPAILIDMSGVDQFTLTYGIILFGQAIGMLFGPFIGGILFDSLKSYDAAFVMAGVLMILSAAIMIFPCRNYKAAENKTEVTYVVTYDQNPDESEAAQRDVDEGEQLIDAVIESSRPGESAVKRNGHTPMEDTEEATSLIEAA